MMRFLAILLLSTCPMAAGFLYSGAEKKALEELSGFVLLLEHIAYEIGAFLTRQQDLFLRFEHAALRESGLLDCLQSGCILGENSVLYEALLQYEKTLHIGKTEKQVLLDYARSLGKRNAAEEIRLAEKTREILAGKLEILKKESAKKTLLYRSTGVVLGLFFLVLVL